MATERDFIRFQIPKELKESAEAQAKSEYLTLSQWLRNIITKELDKNKKD